MKNRKVEKLIVLKVFEKVLFYFEEFCEIMLRVRLTLEILPHEKRKVLLGIPDTIRTIWELKGFILDRFYEDRYSVFICVLSACLC